MRVCALMYSCIHEYKSDCKRVTACAQIHVHLSLMHAYMRVPVHVHEYTNTRVNTCVHARMSECVYVYVCMHAGV